MKTESVKGAMAAADIPRYDATARGVNAPMYAHYARRIVEETGVVRGRCLDMGSGGGYLGLALARLVPGLDFVFLDGAETALESARRNAHEDGVEGRCSTLLADVHDIPLPDGSVDLVISRGSIPFWTDPVKAVREIHRVLSPVGQTFVGVGRGPSAFADGDRIPETPGRDPTDPFRDPSTGFVVARPGRIPHTDFDAIMAGTGIERFKILQGNDGKWIRIWKDQEPPGHASGKASRCV